MIITMELIISLLRSLIMQRMHAVIPCQTPGHTEVIEWGSSDLWWRFGRRISAFELCHDGYLYLNAIERRLLSSTVSDVILLPIIIIIAQR